MRTTWTRLLAASSATCLLVLSGATAASAHEERESTFPPGNGSTPTYRPYDAATPHLVVCKPDSAKAIGAMTDPAVKALNAQLLGQCGFSDIQAAVDAVTVQGTNIYVLPGTYLEKPSYAPPCTEGYDGGVLEYQQIYDCGEILNLITVAGDDPEDPDTVCDGPRCKLQIEGTGQRPEDVVVHGGFGEDGDWIKHNGIKADRADGFYLRNMTFELFRENAVYVHETDGYAIDKVVARSNDLYGILSFASDHGLYKDCEAYYNGDSGVYPGGQSDVNQDNPSTERLKRYAVEITGCHSHHNALGLSGTAGNSVYFHDNDFHDNGAGYVTDSFVGGHPGMPQDHAWLRNNRIHGNNSNYYEKYVQSGICDKKPAERGHETGTVCPAFPVPVGTGVLIAGGNRNLVEDNQIYDNWRSGVKLLWVPGAIRGDTDITAQYDTSNGNHYVGNVFGKHPDGLVQPNGKDVEWDEQGIGNCWQDNTSFGAVGDGVGERPVLHDAALPLPTCTSGGSISPVGNITKTAMMAGCSQYDREDVKDPPGCDWFDSPAQPAGRQAAPGEPAQPATGDTSALPQVAGRNGTGGASLPAQPTVFSGRAVADTRTLPVTGGVLVPALGGLVLALAVLHLRRRGRTA